MLYANVEVVYVFEEKWNVYSITGMNSHLGGKKQVKTTENKTKQKKKHLTTECPLLKSSV